MFIQLLLSFSLIQNSTDSSSLLQVDRLLPLLRGPSPGICRGPDTANMPQCQQRTNVSSPVQSTLPKPNTTISATTLDDKSNVVNTGLLVGTICSGGVALVGLAYFFLRRKTKPVDIENGDKTESRDSMNSISFSSEELNVLETEMSYKDMKRLSFAIPQMPTE